MNTEEGLYEAAIHEAALRLEEMDSQYASLLRRVESVRSLMRAVFAAQSQLHQRLDLAMTENTIMHTNLTEVEMLLEQTQKEAAG